MTEPERPLQPSIPGINTMAVAGLFFAIFLPPIGLLMLHVARSQIRRTGESGDRLAVIGLIVGYVELFTCGCVIPLLLSSL